MAVMVSSLLRDLGRDVGLALRWLSRHPGFAVVTLGTLGLGIGAPTAIFSVVHAVLVRPLPFPEPDRLVQFRIEGRGPAGPVAFDALPVSSAIEWRDTSVTLSDLAVFNDRAATLSTHDGPFRLIGISATPNLFDVLRVPPAIGRTFDADAGGMRGVVLSDATWRRFFAGDPAVIGTTVMLDGTRHLVTGVMPGDFGFPTIDAAFWVSQTLEAGGSRGMLLPAVARIAPGATTAAVADEGRRILADTGLTGDSRALLVGTMQDQMVGGVRRLLWVLLASVGFVFVIALTNIALLLMTRGAGRDREFSIRLALGAGRAQLVRQLVIEGSTLALLGGAAGLVVAWGLLDVLVRVAPPDLPRLRDVSLDGVVLAFAGVLTVATSLVFGLLSASRALGTDPARALGRLGGEGLGGLARASRRRLNVLASGELVLTMVLLVGAGLLVRSFIQAVLVDQGFDPRGALALQINLPAARYPNPAARLAFHLRLLERLHAAGDMDAVGLATAMPNRQATARFDFNPNGVPLFPDPLSQTVAEVRTVSDGFLDAMGVPLRAGRLFRAEDGPAAEPAMVISEKLARQLFPDRSAVGQLLYSGTGTRRVIGVVGDVRPATPGAQIPIAAYLTMRQDDSDFRWFGTATLVVRGANAGRRPASLRALILALDPEMPAFNVRTLRDEVSALVAGPRFAATLLVAFAGVALILAAVGVYGVMTHSASQRTREIGVRVALGATRAQVLRLMLRDGMAIVAAGLGVGLLVAAWLARGLTGLLHEVTPADPLALTSVAALLLVAGLLAAYLPAWRATRVSALDALRDD